MEQVYLVKVTEREDSTPRRPWATRKSTWLSVLFANKSDALMEAEANMNDEFYTRVYCAGDQLSLVKQFGGPKRVRPVKVVQPYTQDEGRLALQAFLREVAKPDSGRAVYGSEVDNLLDQNLMSTVIQVGHASVDNPRGIGVKAYYLNPGSEAATILEKAFGGCAGLRKS